jgi:hypothetical protein
MGQMRPAGNPYASALGGQIMGGYDPGMYDRERVANAAQSSDQAASVQAAAADIYGAYDGGLITKVMGPKPPTPDDGAMFVQKGEYVIKKSSVNKYGKGLLDMLNDGKLPAKKMKSLLG